MIDTIKILGSLLGSGALSQGSGGSVLTNVLGAALGGSQQQQGGGLANVLGGLLGGAGAPQQQSNAGGLGGLLGGLLGGNQVQQQQQTGAADLLGGLFGGGNKSVSNQSGGGLSDLLGAAVTQFAQSQNTQAPATSHEHCQHLPSAVNQSAALSQAEVLIRSMINAAKADGRVDDAEQQKILGRLGDVNQEEADFVRRELGAKLDVNSFIQSIPRGFEQQVYIMSLMAIDLDTNHEAQYLHQLAQGMNLSNDLCNQIHDKLGARKLYS